MKIAIINGPNLNMLGIREPEIYGAETYPMLVEKIKNYCKEKDVDVYLYQSNHEGELVDIIQQCYFDKIEGIVINPGAYTHTSIALLDAIKAVNIPTCEIHISDLAKRDEFRQISYIRPVCVKTVVGHGTDGYLECIDFLVQNHGG